MELLDPIIDFFCKLYDADKRPEARKFTINRRHLFPFVTRIPIAIHESLTLDRLS